MVINYVAINFIIYTCKVLSRDLDINMFSYKVFKIEKKYIVFRIKVVNLVLNNKLQFKIFFINPLLRAY